STGQMASFPLNGVPHNWQARQPEVQALADWTPPNVPALWTDVGACTGTGGCTVTPAAPTGLTASAVTQSGVTLSWTAPAAPAGCPITGFPVFRNATAIGTTANTSFNVTGLAAATTFNFTVAATDAAGTGGPSAALPVTTLPVGNCTTVP